MPTETFGEYLRRQRELRQIPLAEVAAGTKIGIHTLEAIEADRWKSLPAEVFIRGFIRGYAQYIGLDPEEVILRYQAERPDQLPEAEEYVELVAAQYSEPRSVRRPWLGRVLLVLVLVIGAVAGYYWFFIHTPDSAVRNRASTATDSGEPSGSETADPLPTIRADEVSGTAPKTTEIRQDTSTAEPHARSSKNSGRQTEPSPENPSGQGTIEPEPSHY